jgi:hypothetical protein
MAEKKEETASFVLRLSQKIFEGEDGEPHVQWRGNIRHVQSGDESRLSSFEGVEEFVSSKLSDLTLKAVKDKSEEEQKGILTKSFEFWKQVATVTPKLVIDSIKDPKKQAHHIQEQIQEQIHQIGDSISHKIEEKIGGKIDIEGFLTSSKPEIKQILQLLGHLSDQVENLSKQVESLKKSKK